MASIFDSLSTLNLTPQELKALQAYSSGASTAYKGPIEGEYIERGQSIGQDRPRLEADPVDTQEQSRRGANRAGRTFYANTAGDVGTSIPKGAGTSGIYNAASEAAPKAGRGLLRAGGKALGPLGVLLDVANPEEVGNAELTPDQQAEQARGALENMGPQMTEDAVRFGSDLSNRTLDAGLGRTQPIDLSDSQAPRSNLYVQPPEEAQAERPAVTETALGPVAETDTVTVPQAAAKTMQQQEATSQMISQQALQGLNTGELSRTDAATAVVQADAQRSGKELTPQQTQEAVKGELANMKTMDNDSLSKYFGYAMITGGLIASALDESGRTSEMFAQGFQKQLDRNLVEGQAKKKQESAQAKMQQDMSIELAKMGQRQQEIGIKKQSADQSGEYQQGRLQQGQQGLGLRAQEAAATGAYRQQSLGLRGAALNAQAEDRARQQSNWDKMFQFRESEAQRDQGNTAARLTQGNEANLISASRSAQAGQRPLDITTEAAENTVKNVIKEQGMTISKGTQAAVAQQFRAIAKQNPKAVAANPAGIIADLVNQQQYEKVDTSFFGSPDYEVRTKKDKTLK